MTERKDSVLEEVLHGGISEHSEMYIVTQVLEGLTGL